jgi:hypothetical protein
MELLSQNIAAHETEPDYKKFLIDVRKERITFLVFGFPIPNADLDRVVTYYRNAEGRSRAIYAAKRGIAVMPSSVAIRRTFCADMLSPSSWITRR